MKSLSQRYMENGMKRMLMYHSELLKDKQLRSACNRCDEFCGDAHDYRECNQCPVFQMYCELEEFRFAATFD